MVKKNNDKNNKNIKAEIISFEEGKLRFLDKKNKEFDDLLNKNDLNLIPTDTSKLTAEQKKLRRAKIEELVKPTSSRKINFNYDEGFKLEDLNEIYKDTNKENSELIFFDVNKDFYNKTKNLNWFKSPMNFPCIAHIIKDNKQYFKIFMCEEKVEGEVEWLPLLLDIKNTFLIYGIKLKTSDVAKMFITSSLKDAVVKDITLPDDIIVQRDLARRMAVKYQLSIRFNLDMCFIGENIKDFKEISSEMTKLITLKLGIAPKLFSGIEI